MIKVRHHGKQVVFTGLWKAVKINNEKPDIYFECLIPYTTKRRFRSDRVEYKHEWLADWELTVYEEHINICEGDLK